MISTNFSRLSQNFRMILLAHNIRSLHNVGAFFRTADAFGVEKIYLSGYTGCPPRKEIAKTALGSEHRVIWEYREDVLPLLDELKRQGMKIVALEMSPNAIELTKFTENPEKVALVVGSEVEGISPELLQKCDHIVSILTPGMKKSLNVSVATGIALFAISSKNR